MVESLLLFHASVLSLYWFERNCPSARFRFLSLDFKTFDSFSFLLFFYFVLCLIGLPFSWKSLLPPLFFFWCFRASRTTSSSLPPVQLAHRPHWLFSRTLFITPRDSFLSLTVPLFPRIVKIPTDLFARMIRLLSPFDPLFRKHLLPRRVFFCAWLFLSCVWGSLLFFCCGVFFLLFPLARVCFNIPLDSSS